MRNKIKMNQRIDFNIITGTPELLAASEGDFKGEIDLQWDPVTGANFYIIQLSIFSECLNWIQFDIISKSNYTVSGLRSGKRYCFRVAAVNSSGKGPWTEIICKMAP